MKTYLQLAKGPGSPPGKSKLNSVWDRFGPEHGRMTPLGGGDLSSSSSDILQHNGPQGHSGSYPLIGQESKLGLANNRNVYSAHTLICRGVQTPALQAALELRGTELPEFPGADTPPSPGNGVFLPTSFPRDYNKQFTPTATIHTPPSQKGQIKPTKLKRKGSGSLIYSTTIKWHQIAWLRHIDMSRKLLMRKAHLHWNNLSNYFPLN